MDAQRLVAFALVAGVIAATGCGDDERLSDAPATAATPTVGSATPADRPAPRRGRRGTTITLRDSPFGTMLFDARRQAIYVFENDRRNRTVCYGECARAWPPVLTGGEPRAGKGVRRSLLGTLRRRDGTRQVTYRGRPLYFYAHERAGEVRCHNVDLNGGLWWVIGPDGRRRS